MGFGDQLARALWQFKRGGQLYFGVKDPYILSLEDDTFLVCDPADTTKCIRFDAGGVTTATTRVVSLGDADINLGSGVGGKASILASSGNTTMTTAMSGSVMLIDATAVAYALPAIGAGDIGMRFTFFWTVASTANATITAATGDLLEGFANIGVSGAADIDTYFPNGSSHLILTANGTTTGGLKGSVVRYTAINATMWGVEAHLKGSGTQATPFS